jgi:hypothetical protein
MNALVKQDRLKKVRAEQAPLCYRGFSWLKQIGVGNHPCLPIFVFKANPELDINNILELKSESI